MQVPRCKGICRICQPQILISSTYYDYESVFPLQTPFLWQGGYPHRAWSKDARICMDECCHYSSSMELAEFYSPIFPIHGSGSQSFTRLCVCTYTCTCTTYLSQKKLPRKAQPSWSHWIGSSLTSPNPSYSTWRFDWTVGSFSFLWIKIPPFFFFGSACTYVSCCALPCGSVILLEAGIPPYLMLYVYYYLLVNAPAIFEMSCKVWKKKSLALFWICYFRPLFRS